MVLGRLAVVPLAAAFAGACSADLARHPAAEVADSAGLRIVTYDLAGVDVPPYRIVGEPDLEIGEQDGMPEYTLSVVTDLAVAGDGSIVVSDGVAQELRVYDPDGGYRRTLGGPGGGPGESGMAPTVAGTSADTVFAFDARSRRVTAFSTGGDLIDMMTFQDDDVGRPQLMIRQDDGTYLSRSTWVARNAPEEAYDMRFELDSIVVEHVGPTGGLIDTLLVMPGRSRLRRVQIPQAGIFRVQQATTPYAARAFLSSDGSRLVAGRSNAFALELRDPAREAPTVLRVRGVEHPATAAEIRAEQERRIRAEVGDGEIDPFVWRMNMDFLPERLPAFDEILFDDRGHVWVALPEYDASEGYEWLVFTAQGELRGRVATPPDLRLFVVHADWVLGVFSDELDVPYVRRYPLTVASAERPSG